MLRRVLALRVGVGVGIGIGVVAAMVPGDARACGGCFHEPSQTVSTVVTAHRMAFAISTTQTVLWDQIQYSGSPSSFAWVLPVKPGARIELSQDAWMAALDAATQTVIYAPQTFCAPAESQDVNDGTGGGCGAGETNASFAPAASGAALEDAGTAVTVVSQQVVGPYDAVTVRSSQGQALGAWLNANGYDVPASLQPTIDAFTGEGFDFIALKLAPNEGVQAMQPVRVVTPGADLSLPLRMVAAGTGANVGIELWVLGEGRYEPQNFPGAAIDFSKLAWDPGAQVSNYTTLASQALAANGGRGWLTESAGPASLAQSGGPNPPLDVAYGSTCAPTLIPAPASCDAGAVPPGNDDAGGGTDAGTLGQCTATTIPCDDLSVATTGLDVGTMWITRLRADLPAPALSADLTLEASASQVEVPNTHQTTQYTVANYNPCPNGTSSSSASSGSSACRIAASRTSAEDVFGLGLGLLAFGSVVRRGLRRR